MNRSGSSKKPASDIAAVVRQTNQKVEGRLLMLRFQGLYITSTEVFDQPVRYGPIFEVKSGCRVCFVLLMLDPLVLLASAALSGPISSFTGAPTSWFGQTVMGLTRFNRSTSALTTIEPSSGLGAATAAVVWELEPFDVAQALGYTWTVGFPMIP